MYNSYHWGRDLGRTKRKYSGQDARAGGRGASPRRMATIYRIIKEAHPEPWLRGTGSGGAARTVTLEQDGRR